MLPNEKNDLLYLINILEYIGKIWRYTEKANDAEELFENIIKENLKQNIFDIEEIKMCQKSKFDKNIDFNQILGLIVPG
jgi:uncharacterized protein with HEPN domain